MKKTSDYGNINIIYLNVLEYIDYIDIVVIQLTLICTLYLK